MSQSKVHIKNWSLRQFMRYDVTSQRWYFLDEISASNYDEIMQVLKRNVPDGKETTCVICDENNTPHSMSDKYCDSCFAYLNVIGHNPGEIIQLPEKIQKLGIKPKIGRPFSITFNARGNGFPTYNQKGFSSEIGAKICLGGQNGKHCLFIKDQVIPINPDLWEVVVLKKSAHKIYKSDIIISTVETIIYNGRILSGTFTQGALYGGVICENVYLGECLSINDNKRYYEEYNQAMTLLASGDETKINQAKQQLIEIEGLKFPNNSLNESISRPGLVGIIDPRSTSIVDGRPELVRVCLYCHRCAVREQILKNKNEPHEIPQKAAILDIQIVDSVPMVPKIQYDRDTDELKLKYDRDVALLKHKYDHTVVELRDEIKLLKRQNKVLKDKVGKLTTTIDDIAFKASHFKKTYL
jgi:hypothetical protein